MLSRAIQILPGTIQKGGISPRPSIMPVITPRMISPGSGRSEVTPRMISPVSGQKSAPVEIAPVPEPSKPFYKNPFVLIGAGALLIFLLTRKKQK